MVIIVKTCYFKLIIPVILQAFSTVTEHLYGCKRSANFTNPSVAL